MKRRVVASRLSDLLDKKTRFEEQKAKRQAQEDEWSIARRDVLSAASEKIKEYLSHYADDSYMSDLEVRISSSYGDGYEARVLYAQSKVHDDSIALKWEWQASLMKDGSIAKESSSWSGLNSTTTDNISNLRVTLNVLEALASITDDQWKEFLNIQVPDIDDYVTEKVEYPGMHFDQEVWEAKIADMIGTNKAVVDLSNVRRVPSVDYLQNHSVSYSVLRPIGETPKRFRVEQYTIVNKPNDYMQSHWVDTFQMSKEKMYENTLSPDTFTVGLPSSLLHS